MPGSLPREDQDPAAPQLDGRLEIRQPITDENRAAEVEIEPICRRAIVGQAGLPAIAGARDLGAVGTNVRRVDPSAFVPEEVLDPAGDRLIVIETHDSSGDPG